MNIIPFGAVFDTLEKKKKNNIIINNIINNFVSRKTHTKIFFSPMILFKYFKIIGYGNNRLAQRIIVYFDR